MRLLGFIIFCALFTVGCDSQTSGAANERPRPAHLVEATNLVRTPLVSEKRLTGSIAAPRTVQIFTEEQGKITEITVYPGDQVKKGTILIELDNITIRAQLDKAIAAHKQAVLDYKRITKLKPRKLASEDEITRAKTLVEQARAELTLQQARLAHTQIRAPFTGLISERFKEPGDIVPLHSQVLTIYDPGNLIARVNISEIILHSIKLGTEVKLRIDALGDTEIIGTITRKYPLINSSTRQGIIEIKLNQAPANVYPGQFVRVTVKGKTSARLNLPIHVVRHDTRGEYVYRINKENVALYTPVKTGIQLGTRIEILDGLNENEQVVSNGFLKLRNNTPVTIKPSRQKKPPPQPERTSLSTDSKN